MGENTKMPPNQDQRPRTPSSMPSGGANKPQKPGGPVPAGGSPDRGRQGVNNPGKQAPEMDPDRARPDRTKPNPYKEGPSEGSPGADDLDDDERATGPTAPIDRP